MSPTTGAAPALQALVVDDERPALAELVWLLGQDERVGIGAAAASAEEALVALDAGGIDVVFCDIQMPGLDGIALARVLTHFSERPQVVFVTAYDTHAVEAFELQATDYVMKPVRPERLAEAVRRVLEAGSEQPVAEADETIAVELGGVTRLVPRSSVRYVEAQGDYVAAAHRERQPPAADLAVHARGAVAARGLRADPPLDAGRPAARRRGAGGRRAVDRAARPGRAAGQPPALARPSRQPRASGSRRAVTDRPRPSRPAAPSPRPTRVRVDQPAHGRRPDHARRPVSRDIDEQTDIGEVYMRSLVRNQLRLSVGVLGAFVLSWCSIPLLFAIVPGLRGSRVFGLPLSWLLLAWWSTR